MTEDEVVREVRMVREAFAASHGYDIRTMVAALREVGTVSGRELVRLSPRPVVTAGPNESRYLHGAATLVNGPAEICEAIPSAELDRSGTPHESRG